MQTSIDKPHIRSVATPRWRGLGSGFLSLWEHPLGAALLALVVYGWLAHRHGSLVRVTSYPYFNYLADAFLHGQLHLRLRPGITRDLSFFGGNLYLYWAPFPAIVLLPFVAIFGVGFSDVLATLLLAAMNVALVALVLRRAQSRGLIDLDRNRRGLLVLFFALGTVHLTLAPYGMVWFVGQLVGFGAVACLYLATLSLRGTLAFLCAGLAVAAALLTRNHLALAGIWPAWYLLREHWPRGWRRLGGYIVAGLLPVIAAVVFLGWYNWARFGSPTDNGLDYHKMATQFAVDYVKYGAFDLHYVRTNIFYQLINYPFPLRTTSTQGGSIFLLSPVFFALLWALGRKGRRLDSWLLLATVGAVAIPILLLMGTGWVQFGPRYTLDFTLPLLLLTAIGVRRWPTWVVAMLTAVSIAHYIVGAIYLARFV